ncbi:hypothetical protein D9M68_177020 [compost metagenome]
MAWRPVKQAFRRSRKDFTLSLTSSLAMIGSRRLTVSGPPSSAGAPQGGPYAQRRLPGNALGDLQGPRELLAGGRHDLHEAQPGATGHDEGAAEQSSASPAGHRRGALAGPQIHWSLRLRRTRSRVGRISPANSPAPAMLPP